ncbi:MAG: DUF3299 domain-containing protein [Bacteroidota bacterium]
MRRISTSWLLAILVLGLATTVPAQAQEQVSWQTLEQARFEEVAEPTDGRRWVPTFPEDVEALDGKEIRLTGYMTPLDFSSEQMHFLISAWPGDGCGFHLPGGPMQVVEVQAAEGVGFTYDTVAMEGRFELLRDDPYGLLYRIVEARPIQ